MPQFGIIREAVEAFCVPCIELEGFEADDLIATYARLAREQGRPVTIVSSDKDLMQLVSDGVGMLDPIKNKPIGVEEVFEKFGVAPDKVVDVQALAGDTIDNVPGVPGIGVKTAAQLIGEYGDLETLLERAGEIKQPKRRQALIDNAELARVSKRLVKLDDQVPVPTPLDDLKVREPDHEKLLGFLRQQGFRSIITRVENEIRADGKAGRRRRGPVIRPVVRRSVRGYAGISPGDQPPRPVRRQGQLRAGPDGRGAGPLDSGRLRRRHGGGRYRNRQPDRVQLQAGRHLAGGRAGCGLLHPGRPCRPRRRSGRRLARPYAFRRAAPVAGRRGHSEAEAAAGRPDRAEGRP